MRKEIWEKWECGKCNPFLQWTINIGVAISQLASALLLGDPDETISSRTGKAARAGKPLFVFVFAPFLDIFEKDHAELAIEEEEGQKAIWDWAK